MNGYIVFENRGQGTGGREWDLIWHGFLLLYKNIKPK